jgi:hypothetical protein
LVDRKNQIAVPLQQGPFLSPLPEKINLFPCSPATVFNASLKVSGIFSMLLYVSLGTGEDLHYLLKNPYFIQGALHVGLLFAASKGVQLAHRTWKTTS